MKSKILFHQAVRIEAARSCDNRWVRVTLVDYAPPKGLTYRHAHVLYTSVDDGDMQTFLESRRLLPTVLNPDSIREAIREFDLAFAETVIQMGDAGLLPDDEEEDDFAF